MKLESLLNEPELKRIAELRAGGADELLYWVAVEPDTDNSFSIIDEYAEGVAPCYPLDSLDYLGEGDTFSLGVVRLPIKFVDDLPEQ